MADLAELKALYAWMRDEAKDLVHARSGDLELRRVAVPPPPPQAVPLNDAPVDEREVERRDLETLLHSSGADVTPFLRRQ